jgi:hypothetical protein
MNIEEIKSFMLKDVDERIQNHINNDEFEEVINLKKNVIQKVEDFDYSVLVDSLEIAQKTVIDMFKDEKEMVEDKLNSNLTMELIKIQVYSEIGYEKFDPKEIIDKIINGGF